MTTLLSFSLLVAFGRGQAVSPTVIPIVVDGEAWAVPATVGGKEGLFLVLLQQEATRVSSAWLAGRPGEVRLAGQPAGRAKAVADFKGPKVGGKPIVGTLGLDAFRGRAVGFDASAKSLSVWDRISPEAASAWVGAGSVRAPTFAEENPAVDRLILRLSGTRAFPRAGEDPGRVRWPGFGEGRP